MDVSAVQLVGRPQGVVGGGAEEIAPSDDRDLSGHCLTFLNIQPLHTHTHTTLVYLVIIPSSKYKSRLEWKFENSKKERERERNVVCLRVEDE